MDTFIIRAWLVPALMLVAVDHNWWPGKFKKNGAPIPEEYAWLRQLIQEERAKPGCCGKVRSPRGAAAKRRSSGPAKRSGGHSSSSGGSSGSSSSSEVELQAPYVRVGRVAIPPPVAVAYGDAGVFLRVCVCANACVCMRSWRSGVFAGTNKRQGVRACVCVCACARCACAWLACSHMAAGRLFADRGASHCLRALQAHSHRRPPRVAKRGDSFRQVR